MKKLILTGLLMILVTYARAQGFIKAEYFFNTDPGIGSGIAIPIANLSDTAIFTSSISTVGLATGFHFLGLRVQQNDGTFGLFENRGFYISSSSGSVSDIAAAEYFLDVDPGVGNGVGISPVVSGGVVNFTIPVPTNSLATGFHFLCIRTKDVSGHWGLYENRGFYISGATSDAGMITQAEYFLDTDPGIGNATSISPIVAGNTVNFTIPVPTSSLAEGFHFLAIRTKDANGQWGLFENRGFYISTATNDAAAITAAEYFFDTDPGIGNGLGLPVGTAGNTVSFLAQIPATSLSSGFHFLGIRTKDGDGKWGLFETRGFYISETTLDAPDLISAEYFIDSDPGVGNGAPLSFSSSGSTITQSFLLPTPIGLSMGDHLLVIRAKGLDGTWGLFQVDTFTVGIPLASNDLRLTARTDQTFNQLTWTTMSEANTEHFEIEKSRNGIDFVNIGKLKAAGFSTMEVRYNYADRNPEQGLCYYRIKLFDQDGTSSYSNIATLLREEHNLKFTVYPNPASTRVNITSTQDRDYFIQVFNSTGQLVHSLYKSNASLITLDVSMLAAGTYIVRLSDGLQISTAEFIKN